MNADTGPTHDWSRGVDVVHLAAIRRAPARFAPGGALHLLLEVVAHVADEAEATAAERVGAARCVVTLHADGSVSVVDFGRGTAVRTDAAGTVRKPVMSTQDLRFFDREPPALLPDGRPRRGMSTVAALSSGLVHVNRRAEGSWRQRYAHGVPTGDLEPIVADGPAGTTVRFTPGHAIGALPVAGAGSWRALDAWAHLTVELVDERIG